MSSRNASDNNSGRTSSQSPLARRGTAQDYSQFEERGAVPDSWASEPTLEKSDIETSSPGQQAPYREGGGGTDPVRTPNP
jgi:hypothetical protein